MGLIIPGILVSSFAFSSASLLLSVPPTDMPQNTMILTVLIKFPLIFISPLFMPINSAPLAVISPLTYFIDIVNVALGLKSGFGSFGLPLDFLVLSLIGIGFLLISTKLHQKTIQKRF
jgi:ABC-2 type transport system permease protein